MCIYTRLKLFLSEHYLQIEAKWNISHADLLITYLIFNIYNFNA